MVFKWWPFTKKAPPLHRALGEPQDEETSLIVEELATKGRVRKRDDFKRNALHVACLNQPSLELVQMLVELYPKAVQEYDRAGRLPLHAACSNGASFTVIKYLVDQYSEGVLEMTDRGNTPLFCAVENKATLEVIKFLVAQDPEVMKLDKYKLGKSPVHVAANRGAPVEVVQYLLQQRPEAIAEKDVWGKTPLACACAAIPVVDNDDDSKNAVASKNDDEHNDDDNKRSINDKVTSDNDGDDNDNKEINNKELSNNKIKDKDNSLAILRLLTDSARIAEPDRGGMLPLHIACVSGASVEIIAQLLDEYREAIRLPDNNGRLPLHAACMNPRVNLDALDLLHKAYPAALRIFDKTGSVPLHIAIQRKLSASVVHFLIDKEEGAVRTREASSKMYPLHLACRVGADVDVLERLVEIYPVAIEAVDARGNSIFHLACTYRQLTVDFAELLLDKCSFDTIRKVNEEQSLPLHLAVQYKAAMPVLQLLIDHYPEALLCKDTKGNVPLHKAFQNLTPMPILVRLAQQNHHALCRRNNRGDTPMECAPLLLQKQFKRARYWYNLRKAYCPICIRMK